MKLKRWKGIATIAAIILIPGAGVVFLGYLVVKALTKKPPAPQPKQKLKLVDDTWKN